MLWAVSVVALLLILAIIRIRDVLGGARCTNPCLSWSRS